MQIAWTDIKNAEIDNNFRRDRVKSSNLLSNKLNGFTEKLVTAGNLKLIVVVKICRLEVLLADNLNNGVFKLLLERNVLTTRVQVIQQLLTSKHPSDYH